MEGSAKMEELYLKEPTMEEKEEIERMVKEFAEANDEYPFEGLGNFKKVYEESIAEELEIEAGDVLLSINDNIIKDVFDYRYYMKDEYVEVLIRKADGEEWLLEIDKDYDEELGVEFENSLMSEYKSCSNKCIFCFIDQPGTQQVG